MRKKIALQQILPYILLLGGLIGLLASFVLTVEKIELIKNPSFAPSCNISPLLSCGSVMVTPQAEVFGFANSLIGMVSFSVVAAIGAALLAGATFARWFWLGLLAGTLFGIGFVAWLVYQSLYVIGALCPYCMVVWAAVLPIFWYTLLYNLQFKHITVPSALKQAVTFLQRYHAPILIAMYAVIIVLILLRFGADL